MDRHYFTYTIGSPKKSNFFSRKNFIFFIKNNKWLILASIVFLAFKFFLIGVLWHDRLTPPEPDDSYVYINHIESIQRCSIPFCDNAIYSARSYGGFSHLTYQIFFGYLGKILGLNSAQTYHLSFYIGTLMLLPILIFFLKKLGAQKNLIAFSIFILSFVGGGSTIHSFSWVVPCLFALMFFLLVFPIVISYFKKWRLFLAILIPLGIFTHTIFVYFLFILIFYFLIYSAFTKSLNKLVLKKIIFSFLIAAMVYVPLSIYLNIVGRGVAYGPENFVLEMFKLKESDTSTISNTKPKTDSSAKPKTDVVAPGLSNIKKNYYNLIFFNFFGIISFLIALLSLIIYRKYKIMSLFFAGLLFTTITSFHIYGARSLIFLTPITAIFYTFGLWFSFNLSERFRKRKIYFYPVRFFLISGVIVFILVNLLLSLFWNEYKNERNNLDINKDYISYLKTNVQKNEKVYYDSSILTSFNSISDLRKGRVLNPEESNYIVSIKRYPDPFDNSNLNKLFNVLAFMMGIKRQESIRNEDSISKIIPDNFRLTNKFGDVEIYKK